MSCEVDVRVECGREACGNSSKGIKRRPSVQDEDQIRPSIMERESIYGMMGLPLSHALG